MRRYRFGRIAALLAAGYAAVAAAFGVLALVTGDPALLRRLVAGGWDERFLLSAWWVELLLVATGLVQGWALWHVLRGRLAGEPVSLPRPVRLLRAALYLSVAWALPYQLPFIPYQWWASVPGALIQVAVVWLFFVVLAEVLPRWLRLVGLVAGLVNAAIGLAATVADGLGPPAVQDFLWGLPLDNALYVVWLVLVLAGQARDPRWSRATVRLGVVSASLSLTAPISFSFVSVGGVDLHLLLHLLLGLLGVFGLVWQARSAHEPAGPPPAPSPARRPRRMEAGPWPLAAVAVVLPLIPASVNLAQGMPVWIGPRGAVQSFLNSASLPANLLWLAADVLVGVGAPAVLVLVAVVRRTRRLVRVTVWSLSLAAVTGAVSAFTYRPDPDWDLFPEMAEQRLGMYPSWLFTEGGDGELLFGLSPLWFSGALAVSALIVFSLYGGAPAARPLRHVLLTALAASVVPALLPAADQALGPVTTAEDCSPPEDWRRQMEKTPPLTGPRAFVCEVRRSRSFPFADTASDQVLLAHGRRLCAAYTRNDPSELARMRAVEGVSVRDLDGLLSSICPPADASVKATQAVQEREFEEWQAKEQRKCDATPRHRPRIKPARAIRLKEPEWPDGGLALYEPTEGDYPGDDFDGSGVFDKPSGGLVAGGPRYLMVNTNSEFHICVTLETYTRRPPVETKGWDHVVEVGYDSPTGRMEFMDGHGGAQLPDLSLNGRAGHYRIRVHLAWFPWDGDKYGTQRLLIMAYPGHGDKVITYRKPAKGR